MTGNGNNPEVRIAAPEVKRLRAVELVTQTHGARGTRYRANPAHPIHAELSSIFRKLLEPRRDTAQSPASRRLPPDMIARLGKKYLWWKKPREVEAELDRLIARIMQLGDYEDVQRIANALGDAPLKSVLQRAEPGQFDERSWAYWNYRLGLAAPEELPPLPARTLE